MSYTCATRGLGRIGIRDDDAHLTCDGCGLRFDINMGRPPPMWLQRGKAPRGWLGGRNDDGTRWDKCPRCKSEEGQEG